MALRQALSHGLREREPPPRAMQRQLHPVHLTARREVDVIAVAAAAQIPRPRARPIRIVLVADRPTDDPADADHLRFRLEYLRHRANHIATPPWAEQVPAKCGLKLYTPSEHSALAPKGPATGLAATPAPEKAITSTTAVAAMEPNTRVRRWVARITARCGRPLNNATSSCSATHRGRWMRGTARISAISSARRGSPR